MVWEDNYNRLIDLGSAAYRPQLQRRIREFRHISADPFAEARRRGLSEATGFGAMTLRLSIDEVDHRIEQLTADLVKIVQQAQLALPSEFLIRAFVTILSSGKAQSIDTIGGLSPVFEDIFGVVDTAAKNTGAFPNPVGLRMIDELKSAERRAVESAIGELRLVASS